MLARAPIDLQDEIMLSTWLDSVFSTDLFSLGYFAIYIFLVVFGVIVFKLLEEK